MAFDGFILNAVVTELKDCLSNGRIQKIYQPNSNEIVLGIYVNNTQYALVLNVSSQFYSMHLTTSKKINPISAPNFCMLLRKHLMNYKIVNISIQGLERIVIIELTGNNEEHEITSKKLVIELMGKHSNILLLDSQSIIIDALKHYSTDTGASRDIIPKKQYIFPETDKIDIHDFEKLDILLENNQNLESGLLSDFVIQHFSGVSKTLIEYCINVLKIENICSIENYHVLIHYLLDLLADTKSYNVSCISVQNSDYTLTTANEDIQPMQVNFFLDDFYTQKEEVSTFITYRNSMLALISGKLKKVSKKLSVINDKIEECANMNQYQLYGELITSNLYQISKEHLSHIELSNYYTNQTVDIPLDIALSPAENAKKYFKKYHKLKATFDYVQTQKLELEKEINYLESIVYEIQSAENIQDIDSVYEEIQDSLITNKKKTVRGNKKQSKKQQKIHNNSQPIQYMVDNFKILVGKNNKQNDYLTFKVAQKEDIWFHVKDMQGSHVILMKNGHVPSQEIINQCASIAAYHSKASQSSNVAVDYTITKYVKKPNGAKPGMVIYTNQKTVNVQPKKLPAS